MAQNPYRNRLPVSDPEGFFGREVEMEAICSGLSGATPQSFAVVGDRRIGKSSLLKQVLGRHARGELKTASPAVLLYRDFQAGCPKDPGAFRSLLAKDLQLDMTDPSEFAPERVAEQLRARQQHVVFVWDELEVALRGDAVDGLLLENLRSLVTEGVLSFLTATLRDPQSMCANTALAGSSFFNVFHRVVLGPLDRAAALQLISVPSAAAGVLLAEWAEQLLRLAGTFPILLQAACAVCFDNLSRGAAKPDWDEIELCFAAAAAADFRYLLASGMSEEALEVCCCLAEGRQVPASHRRALRSLRRRGLTISQGDSLELFSPCFADAVLDFIDERPTPSPEEPKGGKEGGEIEPAGTVRRLFGAIKECNRVVGYHSLPLVFLSAQDSSGTMESLLTCPNSEEELSHRIGELWKVAFEQTHGPKGQRSGETSQIPKPFRREYYKSRPLMALVALRNFPVHSCMHEEPTKPSWRFSNVGEVYAQYLPGARRCIASPEDCGTIFDGLMQDVCLQIEALTSAMRSAGARGELAPVEGS